MPLVERDASWHPVTLFMLLLLRDLPVDAVKAVAAKLNLGARAREALDSATGLSALAAMAEAAAEMSGVDSALGPAPFEARLAALVIMENEESRRRVMEYLVGFHAAGGLTGDDLLEMGFPEGPAIREMLEALRRERLDGKVKGEEEERAFIRRRFGPKLKGEGPSV